MAIVKSVAENCAETTVENEVVSSNESTMNILRICEGQTKFLMTEELIDKLISDVQKYERNHKGNAPMICRAMNGTVKLYCGAVSSRELIEMRDTEIGTKGILMMS